MKESFCIRPASLIRSISLLLRRGGSFDGLFYRKIHIIHISCVYFCTQRRRKLFSAAGHSGRRTGDRGCPALKSRLFLNIQRAFFSLQIKTAFRFL